MNKLILLITAIALLTTGIFYLFSSKQTEFEINSNEKKKKDSDLCPFEEPDFRSMEKHFDTLKKMKSAHMSEDKLEVMKVEVPKDPKVISRIQLVDYLLELNFTALKVEAIQFLNPYIVALSTKDVIKILSVINFTEEKLIVLDAIKITIHDGTEENKKKIVNTFSMNSDKQKATDMLKDVNPLQRDCIFGDVREKFATFVIDTSGSMSSLFTKDDGTTTSRLDAVKEHLSSVIENQLKDYQSFNIVKFNSYPNKWKDENVAANSENIKDALQYINSLTANGGTDIDLAMKMAFTTSKDLEAIYFLGDGQGTLKPDTISNLQKDFDPKVKINTTAFVLGGNESASIKRQAIDQLSDIARQNQGSFKQFE